MIFSLILTLFCSATYGWETNEVIPYLIFSLMFILPILFQKIRFLLESRVLLFLGFISYPLYLIHENMMIFMIIDLNKLEFIPEKMLPIIPILIVIFLSYLIVRFGESSVKGILKKVFLKFKIEL